MKWYSKYLEIFEVAPSTVSENTKKEIRYKLSQLQYTQPLVSVVMIAHNEECRIWASLWSLSENCCDFPVEIIGIDNCSTDTTGDIFNQSGIQWFKENRKSPGYARQCGLEHAQGTYCLCVDADTLYPPLYIQTMVGELRKPNIAAVYGLWNFISDSSYSKAGLTIYESIRNIHLRLLSIKRPELCVRGMSFGFYTEHAHQISFRTNIQRGEDGYMAFKLKTFGKIKMISTSKTRVRTSSQTLNKSGGLFNHLITRIKSINGYFTSKKEYKDKLKNLI